jgi:carboxyl-terminal processing protease
MIITSFFRDNAISFKRNIMAWCVAGLWLFAAPSLMTFYAQSKDDMQTIYKIPELLNSISMMYVEEVDKMKLERDIVKGMHNGLSPFSEYHKAETIKKVLPQHKDAYQSLGISYKFKGDTVEVIEVLPGSGAEKGGLQSGDKLFMINGENFQHIYYLNEIADKFIGESMSKVEIRLKRDKELLDVEVVRNPVEGYHLVVFGNTERIGAINDYPTAIKLFDAIYPDSVSNGLITEYGIRYMLDYLDPHSSYISLEDLHDMETPLKGSFSGVGVRFQIDKDTINITETIPTGPSEKVGVMAGDKIIFINDELVAGVGIKNSGVRERLLGEKGTTVRVKMLRKGSAKLLEFVIIRDAIPIHSLDCAYMVANGIGYVKLNNFSATTVDEFREAIKRLQREGMKDLIIDLQGNGGGYLMTAVNLSDELLAGRKLVTYTEGRTSPYSSYNTKYTGLVESGKIIVLVDENSASASEIVSGAIQDWDRGLIVGRRTFSKGLVQKPVSLPDGTSVRITTSRYYTPSGRCIQKPYDHGSVEYRMEKYDRYESGEVFHQDSVKLDTTVKYYTQVKKRLVYGGGGIMPDVFVPLDTSGTSGYFSRLIRKGVFSSFALNYVNDNRDDLKKKYPTFEKFNKEFKTEKIIKELTAKAEKEGVEFDKDGFAQAEKTIAIRLKANIAQYLFGPASFYEVINELNETLQVAIKVMQDNKQFEMLGE